MPGLMATDVEPRPPGTTAMELAMSMFPPFIFYIEQAGAHWHIVLAREHSPAPWRPCYHSPGL
jgi:hypothetical protein